MRRFQTWRRTEGRKERNVFFGSGGAFGQRVFVTKLPSKLWVNTCATKGVKFLKPVEASDEMVAKPCLDFSIW